jgi:CRP-like cAMP-binding protein
MSPHGVATTRGGIRVKKTVNAKWIERLGKQPLLRSMSTRELHRIAPLFDAVTLPAGHVLMREGQPGRETFLIESGEVVVTIDGVEVNRLGAGEVVGEMAVLEHEPRTATVTAATEISVLVAEARAFSSLAGEPYVGAAIASTIAHRLRSTEASR